MSEIFVFHIDVAKRNAQVSLPHSRDLNPQDFNFFQSAIFRENFPRWTRRKKITRNEVCGLISFFRKLVFPAICMIWVFASVSIAQIVYYPRR